MSRIARAMYRTSEGIARIIAPRNRFSQDYFEEELARHCVASARWLDIGCGHQVLPAWRGQAERELLARCGHVVGLDLDIAAMREHRSIRLLVGGSATCLPFPDESFDLVTANMVVEHLDQPGRQFAEIARILRPGGVFLYHTPNARGYPARVSGFLPDGLKRVLARLLEGRAAADVYPTYYRANTRAAAIQLAQTAGLTVERTSLVTTSPVFGVVPPLAALELVWLRALEAPRLAEWRTNLLVSLRKPEA